MSPTSSSPLFTRLTSLLRSRSSRPLLYGIGAFITYIPMIVFLNDHVAQIMWVQGESMSPFLNNRYGEEGKRDVVFANMYKPTVGLERGMAELISGWEMFRTPHNPEKMAVKRVTALPGDEVYTREPYPVKTAQVPPGNVWVEGDDPNPRNTLDSHTYGPVSALH
ncbi:MAG: hypothetical protein M1827_001889 [Pycnora praestabilis]|nr:MAG: hypothetical protein M1827_001889 [Pycnora praestabilis]